MDPRSPSRFSIRYFCTCLSFCSQVGGVGIPQGTEGDPPEHTTPPDQAHHHPASPPDHQTPPRTRHTPPTDQAHHPPGPGTPPGPDTPQSRHPPPGANTPPPEADSGIRSTSGRYASYWNAFLFHFHAVFHNLIKYLDTLGCKQYPCVGD